MLWAFRRLNFRGGPGSSITSSSSFPARIANTLLRSNGVMLRLALYRWSGKALRATSYAIVASSFVAKVPMYSLV